MTGEKQGRIVPLEGRIVIKTGMQREEVPKGIISKIKRWLKW